MAKGEALKNGPRGWLWVAMAAAAAVPGLYLRLTGIQLSPPVQSLAFGVAILGAAFLLTWATEVAELDISQSLALALLALIAVLPEYAVDMYFAWEGARQPEYIHYATANMTGANRLLIGFGWALVVFLFWVKKRQPGIALDSSHSISVTFLLLATVYSFSLFLKRSIHPLDSMVLVGLFVLYIVATSRSRMVEPELVGPPATIASLPKGLRRGAVVLLFLFSAAAIFASAKPFADGLVATGETLQIDKFILVQWVAPLASEAPEILVAAIFTLRANPGAGLGTLVSSKVNQWTLLVGTLPLVYSISLGRPEALPLDSRQAEEVFLTSAQSLFALVVLADLRLNLREAAMLFVLFSVQLFFPTPWVRYLFAGLYLGLAAVALLAGGGRLLGRLFPQALREVKNSGR